MPCAVPCVGAGGSCRAPGVVRWVLLTVARIRCGSCSDPGAQRPAATAHSVPRSCTRSWVRAQRIACEGLAMGVSGGGRLGCKHFLPLPTPPDSQQGRPQKACLGLGVA